MRESPILHQVRAALTATGRVLIWRNNVGVDTSRGVRYGIGVGSPDLVGVLKPEGRMLGVEVKTPIGRLSHEQRLWRDAFIAAGGVYILARSADDAIRGLP
jgi:hypothetical protein